MPWASAFITLRRRLSAERLEVQLESRDDRGKPTPSKGNSSELAESRCCSLGKDRGALRLWARGEGGRVPDPFGAVKQGRVVIEA